MHGIEEASSLSICWVSRERRLGTSEACILRKAPDVSPGKFTSTPVREAAYYVAVSSFRKVKSKIRCQVFVNYFRFLEMGRRATKNSKIIKA